MAYTVGSASVDIVPDFKNAQLAITRFFNSQKDQIRVPVKLDIDKDGKTRVEREARDVGDRIGQAINQGTAKSDVAAIRQAQKAADAIAAARRKAFDDEAREEARKREQNFRDEEREFQSHIRNQMRMMAAAIKAASADEKAKIQIEIDREKAIASGREYGGLVIRAMREETRQNAGLIAAVLAGVLAAGAPAAIGAAVALFGGIGIVAAAQSERVRSAWLGTWQEIKAGAISDAQSLVAPMERSSEAIGRAFQRMRPLVRDAFESVGPYIDSFTDSIARTAENALPGLVRSVQAAGPVVQGLGRLMESAGSGIGAFFDRLSLHAPAAGMAAAELGRSLQALLPPLAEILGQGAETAAIVLPAVTGAFRTLDSVLQAVGGSLPAVMTGFLAFRTLRNTNALVTNFAAGMATAAMQGGRFAGVQGRLATGAGAVARVMPGVAIAAGLITAAMAVGQQRINEWTQALIKGGAAARQAKEEMSADSWVDSALFDAGAFEWLQQIAGWFGVGEHAANDAKKAFDEYIKGLTPLERAQRNVAIATDELARMLADESVSSEELARQKAKVERAAAAQAAEEDRLAQATRGVTEAMVAQSEAARARADSSFAYEKSLNDLEDSLAAYNEALASGTEEEKSRALLDLQMSYNDVAEAARKVAFDALPAMLDEQQKSIIADKAQLDSLNALHDQYGDLGPILEAQRTQLAAATSGANANQLAQAQLAAALAEVGVAVESIPDSAAIKIDADDVPLVKDRLIDLGFTVTTLPGGSVAVEAKTDEAKANLGTLSGLLADLGIQVATPTVGLDPAEFLAKTKETLGQLEFLNGQNPTPTASLNPKPFQGTAAQVQNDINTLAKQNPTPPISANPAPFQGVFGGVMRDLGIVGRQNPTPTVSLVDYSSARIDAILSRLNSLRDRTITVTTVEQRVINTINNQVAFRQMGGNTGGAVEEILASRYIPRYDGGGEIYGRGGPWDDLNVIRASPGEHMLDARDVALMGGQAGVYAFRDMLNSGQFSSPKPDNTIRAMVATQSADRVASAPEQASYSPSYHLYTPDVPTAFREIKAKEHQEAVLRSPWRGR